MSKEKLLMARMVIYSDLAKCFYYPQENLLEFINSDEMNRHNQVYKLVEIDLQSFLKDFESWRNNNEDILIQLQKEYTRLFVTSKPYVPAPPYGSLYLENEGMIWGKTTRELVKLYADAGLLVSEDFNDLPDHFAVELEFAFYLIREKMAALGLNPQNNDGESLKNDAERIELIDSIEKRFYDNHLLKWGQKFIDNVLASSENSFYCSISRIAKTFLEIESKRLINKESI